jgi:hypothetical protein
MYKKLKTLGLASALVICSAVVSAAQDYSTMTGAEKIDSLIATINTIQNSLEKGEVLSVGAVGYAAIGGVIEDGSLDAATITPDMLNSYLAAKDAVLAHDYETAQTAQQMFTQEHAAAMVNLNLAVDGLVDATSVIMTATSVAEVAATADTSPEQTALQGMLATDEYSIDASEVNAYNEAAAAVEGYAQQAGAFMAAANNESLTASIDTYAQQGSFVVGTYSAITYTQSVDEFVITWADAGFSSGWQGYLTPQMKTAEDVFGAGQYIEQYGSLPTEGS